MFKSITQGLLKQALAWLEAKFKHLRDNTDLDHDGIKDFDEYPAQINELKIVGEELIDCVDFPKASGAFAKIMAGVDELKTCVDFDRAEKSVARAQVAQAELTKLTALAIANLKELKK